MTMLNHMPFLMLFLFLFLSPGQSGDNHHFSEKGLRIDYYLSGDRDQFQIILDELFLEDQWAGNPHQLLDTMNLGHFLVKMYDLKTNILIFSSGFSTLFEEWQTTAEAIAGQSKVLGGTLRTPFPRQPVQVEIMTRDAHNLFTRCSGTWIIDPGSVDIRRERRAVDATLIPLMENGPSSRKVDLILVGEGYTSQETDKFRKDANRMITALFDVEPYRSNRDKFNVCALWAPSPESGIDDPAKGKYMNTGLNFSFNTFGSQRYAMSFDSKNLGDQASATPCDALIILMNTDQYGGGGIFNLYASIAVDDRFFRNILLHELGHSFAGLGDEYYTKDVAYNDFYPTDVEPWEPNLTTLAEPENVKWKGLLSTGIPIPTPWDQDKYDKENEQYAGKMAEMKLRGETNQKVNRVNEAHYQKIQEFFEDHDLRGQIGLFEGGGYIPHGIYRPATECIMFSNRRLEFDAVCAAAILRRIQFYTE